MLVSLWLTNYIATKFQKSNILQLQDNIVVGIPQHNTALLFFDVEKVPI